MKKISLLLILLCVCMLLPLASCGKEPENPAVSEFDQKYDDKTRETARDLIPEDYDLENQTIAFFYPRSDEKSVLGDSESTDIIFSRIHERNLTVEERLNVDIEFIDSGTTAWRENSDIIKREIQTMSAAWEAAFAQDNMVVEKRLFNYFHEFNDSNYIDIDERWWYPDAIMELSVDNNSYRFLYGDISINTLGKTGCLYYNKELFEQYVSANKNGDEPYQLVLDGKWTFEEFSRLVKKCNIEKGGDGSNDIHGYSLFKNAEEMRFFQEGVGITMYERDASGFPVLNFNNEKTISYTEKLYSLLYENEGAWLFYPGDPTPQSEHKNDFPDGKVVFLLGFLNTAIESHMREMKPDFGILPFPKWDEDQEEYRSLLHNTTIMAAIPVCTDIDKANEEISAVIEVLASESYRRVSVPFYEAALKSAYNRDDFSAQMIDIIAGKHDKVKSTLTKNFVHEYVSSLGSMGNIFHTLMSQKSKNFVSTYDSILPLYEEGIKTLIQEYKNGKI
ncbi:MAG: extracellular solute-binding protein [Clostridia bacterium]|nr:extracellular solute-binding protein [Clostridia bacterium]